MWRYGVFAAWATAAAAVRLQALVLLPAFLVAVAARRARRAGRDAPAARCCSLAGVAVGVTVAVALLVVVVGGELSTRARARRVHADRRERHRCELGRSAIAWHAFDVAILGLAIAVLAIAALARCVLAGRDTTRRSARSSP